MSCQAKGNRHWLEQFMSKKKRRPLRPCGRVTPCAPPLHSNAPRNSLQAERASTPPERRSMAARWRTIQKQWLRRTAGAPQLRSSGSWSFSPGVWSWWHHHSAKFRDLNLGMVQREPETFQDTESQRKDLQLHAEDSEMLRRFSHVAADVRRRKPTRLALGSAVLEMTTEGRLRVVEQLADVGFCIVDTKRVDKNAIHDVVGWLTPGQEPYSTIYGSVFDVRNEESNAINLANTSIEIGFHQDLPYYSTPPAIQALHCLKEAERGGESMLKNVYLAAIQFREAHPKHFDCLSRRKTMFQKVHHKRSCPVHICKEVPIMEVENGELRQVNWAPLVEGFTRYHDDDSWQEYYHAYVTWKKYLDDFPHFETKLEPGQLLIFNNQHMLHARKAFGGYRELRGFYYSDEQWISLLAESEVRKTLGNVVEPSDSYLVEKDEDGTRVMASRDIEENEVIYSEVATRLSPREVVADHDGAVFARTSTSSLVVHGSIFLGGGSRSLGDGQINATLRFHDEEPTRVSVVARQRIPRRSELVIGRAEVRMESEQEEEIA